MSFNFGKNFNIQIFGESHGEAIGVVIDGLAAGIKIDEKALLDFLARRKTGGLLSTSRKEADIPHFISGLRDMVTTGAPITAVIQNSDVKSGDYKNLASIPRPSHADFAAMERFGQAADLRGGGMFSGRLTAPLCVAGGIAIQILERQGVKITSAIKEIGGESDPSEMERRILAAKEAGDSVGGIVEVSVTGLETGLGGHMFDGVENKISSAVFAVPGVKGIEFGAGFEAARMKGSEHNDCYTVENGKIAPKTNNSGGIVGGMTTGAPIILRAALKPTPSIALPQKSVDINTMKECDLIIKGRHDPCIVIRATPALEAAAALAILDIILSGRKK